MSKTPTTTKPVQGAGGHTRPTTNAARKLFTSFGPDTRRKVANKSVSLEAEGMTPGQAWTAAVQWAIEQAAKTAEAKKATAKPKGERKPKTIVWTGTGSVEVTVPGQVAELLSTVTTDSKLDVGIEKLIASAPAAKSGRGVAYRLRVTDEQAYRLNELARELRTANQAKGDKKSLPVEWACSRLVARTPDATAA